MQSARIVAEHGDQYLPIFERLEHEFNEWKAREDTLDRAIKLAAELDDPEMG